jgi:hypothetical protein
MNKINIEATRSSPSVEFEDNVLVIKGQSYPENAVSFYAPVFAWLDNYLQELEGKGVFKFYLVYMNTSSAKCIMDIIDKLQEAYNRGKNICINWYYDPDNESLLECAEEFKEDVELPFDIIPVEGLE